MLQYLRGIVKAPTVASAIRCGDPGRQQNSTGNALYVQLLDQYAVVRLTKYLLKQVLFTSTTGH